MIYISSDWHVTRETIGETADRLSKLQPEDVVLFLGDLCNEWESEAGEPWFVGQLEQAPCCILFLDGNHDDMNYLDRLPESECLGAKGHWIGRNLFHIKRGEVLTWGGRTFLTLGGGYSGAGYISRHQDTWQVREMPSQAELDHGLERCVQHGFSFDYILSHAAPLSVMRRYELSDEYNNLHAYLDGIKNSVSFKKWFFGHHHRRESLADGFEIVYQELIPLGSAEKE